MAECVSQGIGTGGLKVRAPVAQGDREEVGGAGSANASIIDQPPGYPGLRSAPSRLL
jgi:hypothetical protein